MALSSSLLLKYYAVKEELIWLAVFSVAVSAVLTHFMAIRSMGIAGVGGLSLVYLQSGGRSFPETILIILITALVVVAVLLAIYADEFSPTNCHQGE